MIRASYDTGQWRRCVRRSGTIRILLQACGSIRSSRTPLLLVTFVVISIASCSWNTSGDGSGAGDATPIVVPTPTPLSGTPVLGTLSWASTIDEKTSEPEAVVQVFQDSDPAIYAVIEIERIPAGSEFEAVWEYNDTSLDGLEVTLTVPDDRIDGWIEFHLQRSEEPWPDGEYRISVFWEGQPLLTETVGVVETS